MLYLVGANVLITASNSYYPIDQVPEFWSWLQHQVTSGHIKIPQEVMEEVRAGRSGDDPLLDWISEDETPMLCSWKKSLTVLWYSKSFPPATRA